MKTAIVIISDPNAGSQEAVGRAANALAYAYECKQAGDDVAIVFKGAGTRWPELLNKLTHPLHQMYQAVREHVVGVSCTCAERFGATEGAKASGVPIVGDVDVPGTNGVLGLRPYVTGGYSVLTF